MVEKMLIILLLLILTKNVALQKIKEGLGIKEPNPS